MQSIYTPPVCCLEELNHLFIELTSKNCNQRCKKCFIDFPFSRNVKDFIQIDKIKQALVDTKSEPIKCIYLTGAEPMTHPDFNSILRLCLKRGNVCVLTNATFINEKKARFLKKVEEESEYQIIFKLSFAHYDEVKNDDVRFRGSFRQNMYALKCLDKYNFTNVICVNNYYKEDENVVISEFKKIIETMDLSSVILQTTKWYDKENLDHTENVIGNFDCKRGRLLTQNGVFACSFLTNDYRGRMGTDMKDFSKNVRLETPCCATCISNKEPMFGIEIS